MFERYAVKDNPAGEVYKEAAVVLVNGEDEDTIRRGGDVA